MLFYVIILCIQAAIWGWAVNKIVENKGYDENWFWWGFFFGIFALLVALTKSDLPRTTGETSNYFGEGGSIVRKDDEFRGYNSGRKITEVPGGWRCQNCGNVNAGYVGTCGCGCSKSGEMPERSFEPEQQVAQDVQPQMLYCTSCGKQMEADSRFCRYCGAKVNIPT